MQIKTILVATDFSSDADAALDAAIDLAKAFDSKLELFHAYHVEIPPIYAGFGGDFMLIMTKREDRGRINSPFEPTSEDTFRRNNRLYVRQTVERGSGSPEIRLSTASGSIEVRNNGR